MRIWFDTEFIEDGKTIDLMSIGAVREDGALYYSESSDCDLSRAGEWVQQNVMPHLRGGVDRRTRLQIRDDLLKFAGTAPEFWGYYADYDWVVLCQLFGLMVDLPRHWPMYCRDVQQLVNQWNLTPPGQLGVQHNALADAIWTRDAHLWMERVRNAAVSQ